MPGEIFTLNSVDKADIGNSDDTTNEELFQISTEYLQSLNPGNYPPSQLHLKIGAVVILLRNLNVEAGLCNGTRLIIKEIGLRILKVVKLNGIAEATDEIHFIPRINLSTLPGQYPFIMTRKQFPIKLCFATTINKAQGQSLNTVGIDLRYPVFAHGQNYVAFSRSTNFKNITVLLDEENQEERIENVVYPELLL